LRYLFEDYALDTDRRELHRETEMIVVTPQVFDLLVYLIQNRKRVVSRDDLVSAIWNGRIVPDGALTTRLNAARSAIGDSGEKKCLIKTLPRKGFRFVGALREVNEPSAASANSEGRLEPAKLPLPDRASIAVLPFVNLDSGQDYFVDRMVEEIITALSRFNTLFVIARTSSFTHKGHAVDVRQVGRELGVRYVLEGSVRTAGNRVRIAAQLVDTATGVHLWADRFDGRLGDIFDLQDQVAESVAGAISPAVLKAEFARAKRKPTESLDAYDLYLRGWAKQSESYDQQSNEAALRLFYRAIELDPDFALAYGRAAMCYADAKASGWLADTSNEVAEANRLAQRAVELGEDNAMALATGAYALAYVSRDLEAAVGIIERAIVLNPNSITAWYHSGWIQNWLGKPKIAIERFARTMRLSPVGPLVRSNQSGTAHAHFFLGRYDEAASWATRASQDKPDFQPGLRIDAASNAMAGRPEQAQRAVARLRQVNPKLRVSNLKNVLGPYRHAEHLSVYEEGLRKAGLPE
jgi:TolB-like protein/Tfp pilus assembly protein PilF